MVGWQTPHSERGEAEVDGRTSQRKETLAED
jgi:hypothetical protein